MDSRQQFEEWAKTGSNPLEEDDFRRMAGAGTYYFSVVRYMWEAWHASREPLSAELDQLKKEISEMKAGIDPKWGLMDQSILVDYLREQTNFCAEKFDGMIQFAVDAANREYK